MQIASSTFEFLRHVRLGDSNTRYYPTERPHSVSVCKKQTSRPIARHVGSIRFLAKYCPLLVSLHITYSLRRFVNKATKAIEPLAFAYRELVQKCPDLEVVGFETCITVIEKDENVPFRHGHWQKEDVQLELKAVPIYLRDELVESWVRTALREHIEYGEPWRLVYTGR